MHLDETLDVLSYLWNCYVKGTRTETAVHRAAVCLPQPGLVQGFKFHTSERNSTCRGARTYGPSSEVPMALSQEPPKHTSFDTTCWFTGQFL